MLDRIFSFIALFMLTGFMAILVWYVHRLDLAIICGIVTVMAAYDFYDETIRRTNAKLELPDPGEQKDAI